MRQQLADGARVLLAHVRAGETEHQPPAAVRAVAGHLHRRLGVVRDEKPLPAAETAGVSSQLLRVGEKDDGSSSLVMCFQELKQMRAEAQAHN